MSLREETMPPAEKNHPLSGLEAILTRMLYIDGEKLAYIVILILAILTRFWDLGVRVMSHDESLHTRYAWNLYKGNGFSHTPLMHGPLLFHMTALSYLLFGDNDFTSRIYPAVIGIAVVLMPYFMRKWLGRFGALATSFLFLISPLILYYSRYIRHDLPAILAALVIAVATWRYVEDRKFHNLLWIGGAQAVLFASKEVSFIYIAIFGSFLMLFFITRLLDTEWKSRALYAVFVLATITALIAVGVLAVSTVLPTTIIEGTETLPPPVPQDSQLIEDQIAAEPLKPARIVGLILLSVSLAALFWSVAIGQWHNLRRFPELDVMIVLGSLILPMLTPFVMHFTRIAASRLVDRLALPPTFIVTLSTMRPMDESQTGILRSLAFTAPMALISVIFGAIWGMRPPGPRTIPIGTPDGVIGHPSPETDPVPLDASAVRPQIATTEASPDLLDWIVAFFSSRWWAIAAIYWLIFFFFFTTMFTNGAGIGTGVIGSLGYWLEQQEVKRGGQPWYYYILVLLPIYEFLPVILSLAAGAIGLGTFATRLLDRLFNTPQPPPTPDTTPAEKDDDETQKPTAAARRPFLDLDAPANFPALLFIGYWAAINVIAYSIAGEKMPWLTTHLTTPLILLGGWVIGRLLERIEWPQLRHANTWPLFALFPLLVITLLRVTAPLCTRFPANPLCNTIIPPEYQSAIFSGQTITDLSHTYGWLAGLIVLVLALAATFAVARRAHFGQVARIASLCLIGWLTFLTARAAWWAAFVNYDDATEYLVYAHSAGAVKEVMDQIDEISLKTTDGYGLRVAYDNRVSWPYSWYLRNYYNAIYYGEQPSRGLIGDAPVILAGPDNYGKVESLLGDRYYRFEYIRMWWPMQDYFNLENFRGILRNPALQRGVWDIFYRRDYTTYGQAVGHTFELSQWPVAERMRLYIRKDTFAQVWDYGVAASEIAEAVDPYADSQQQLIPELTFGAGLLTHPHGLALGPDGLLYVADTDNHRIVVFDTNGNWINTFGSHGMAPQPGVLNEPWDVALGPDGTVYVADTWNHRVVEYSPEGTYLDTWGFEGPNQLADPLAFWGPRGIALDDQGNVYLADTGNKRIQVFDSRGRFLRQVGVAGPLDGQLDEPVGLAFDPEGNLYVADTWNQRIQVFSPDGDFLRQWIFEGWFAQTNERPYIAVDDSGNVYVTDPEAFRVVVFSYTGQYRYSFGDFDTITLAGGVLADDEGHLFVADTGAGTIQRYNISPFLLPAQ